MPFSKRSVALEDKVIVCLVENTLILLSFPQVFIDSSKLPSEMDSSISSAESLTLCGSLCLAGALKELGNKWTTQDNIFCFFVVAKI